jgi:hypothetical protein
MSPKIVPYVFHVEGQEYGVDYLPAESNTAMFGGNSNWRSPVWMPVNVMLMRALLDYYAYYGEDFKIECPTGSGRTGATTSCSTSTSMATAAPGSVRVTRRDGREPWRR